MGRFDWLSEYLARLEDEHVLVRRGSAQKLAPAHVLEIDAEDWGRAARQASLMEYRWCGLWGDENAGQIRVYACLENDGDYLVLQTAVATDMPVLPSHVPSYPIADRPERHAQDMLGLVFSDSPDERRWIRHQAWPESSYPLRRNFSLPEQAASQPAPADGDYPFRAIRGEGVCEIPVGPVHAGIIEPGHFRFNVVGEEILSLEQHLGYVHKGIEKAAVGRSPEELVRLAGRVSGDSSVAHAWAACQALERASGCYPGARDVELRGLFCERERVANHLGDIGAICNDVGFAFALYQCSRLREDWLRRNRELFGHRLLMDLLVPGGVTRDLDSAGVESLKQDHQRLRQETDELFDILLDQPSLEDRLLNTGVLRPATAKALGCTGYVGKASGQGFDLRISNPYPPYAQLPMTGVCLSEGDVMARVQVRMEEIRHSLAWMDQLLERFSPGESSRDWRIPDGPCEGLGLVEGWRGEIITYVRLDASGRVARFFPRDPSWHSWPALERIVMGNIVPDFPVCNKSVNGSYSGQDL
ncbi:hydrogenase large subunit [Thiolapillus brandeum]|uniref:Formate hydrogenlyase large subunit HyfG n=1 Tax=Thiolapillus brandeum TaxID=1076588 RepID=A0A7U6JHA0_9GAMM|nr:NADH-quinone oxidoreductase subunit C [Thiolapillus brandeum]BAO43478.1 formate hydrogenlyase large subunit HyfG [Thiolapillus brandeum]